MQQIEYAGFWIRVGATLIDSLLLMLLIIPALTAIYGNHYWLSESLYYGYWQLFLNHIGPALAVILFWVYKSATPGKMATRLTILDARTGGKPSTAQFVGRYLAYYVSIIPFCLGLLWVAFDRRKQGWHDKLAGTVVVRQQPEPVVFENRA